MNDRRITTPSVSPPLYRGGEADARHQTAKLLGITDRGGGAMTTTDGTNHNGRPPGSSQASTVIPNGPLIEKLRKAKGWTRRIFGDRTDKAVLDAVSQSDDPEPELAQRVKARERAGRDTGLSLSALHRLAHSKRVYPMTVRIAALTLGVPTESLIIPD